MKKYLFCLVAIVLAIALSAFTNPERKFLGRTYFIVLISNTEYKAENVNFYDISAAPIALCGSTPTEISCSIDALDKYTYLSIWGNRILNSSGPDPYLTISAEKTVGANKWYIGSIKASDSGAKGIDFDFKNADTTP